MIKNKYLEFTPEWSGFSIKYHLAGLTSSSAILQIYFIWGKLFLYLPWKHSKLLERKKTLKELREDKLKTLKDPAYKIKKKYEKVYYDGIDAPEYGIYISL